MTLRYSAHLDTLYATVPPMRRFAAAARDGFDCVEFWSPPGDVEEVLGELAAHHLQVASVNTHPGPDPGDFGRLGDPDAVAWWREDFLGTLAFARGVGSRAVNVLVGGRRKHSTRARQIQTVHDNLRWALERLAADDPVLLLEPLNAADRRSPLLRGVDDALSMIATLAAPARVRILFDAYHLAQEEDDLIHAWRTAAGSTGHVQFADYPGRGEPGTGEIPFPALAAEIERSGYAGWIGLEYIPADADHELSAPRSAHPRVARTAITGTAP
jgi:hydroxypyruvate isomerase